MPKQTMKWVSNTLDPDHPNWDKRPIEVQQHILAWLSDKIIGEPKATDDLTVEQLKQHHYIGVYTNE